jgi:putative sigma-54 modulation protein
MIVRHGLGSGDFAPRLRVRRHESDTASMQIQIHTNGVQNSAALNERALHSIESAMKVWRDQVTRVEVHLHDDNGPKSGRDKRCVLEIRLAGLQPMAVEAANEDLYKAIDEAAGKAERAVRHKLERHDAHKSSH